MTPGSAGGGRRQLQRRRTQVCGRAADSCQRCGGVLGELLLSLLLSCRLGETQRQGRTCRLDRPSRKHPPSVLITENPLQHRKQVTGARRQGRATQASADGRRRRERDCNAPMYTQEQQQTR